MLSMEESGRDRPQDRVTLPPGIGRETNTEDDGETPSPPSAGLIGRHQRRDLTDKDRGDQHAEHGVAAAPALPTKQEAPSQATTGRFHLTQKPRHRALSARASSIDDATEEYDSARLTHRAHNVADTMPLSPAESGNDVPLRELHRLKVETITRKAGVKDQLRALPFPCPPPTSGEENCKICKQLSVVDTQQHMLGFGQRLQRSGFATRAALAGHVARCEEHDRSPCSP